MPSSPKRKAAASGLAAEARSRAKRARLAVARSISTQPAHKALNERHELDTVSFVHAHQHEIRALHDSMARSRSALAARAFQQVPRHLRRRTASHNVKKVPKRLRPRAAKEMRDDNTPTVTSRRREPTREQRLQRAPRAAKQAAAKDAGPPAPDAAAPDMDVDPSAPREGAPVTARRFAKRQRTKSWLPTHLWHAKRARMTPPDEPLWGFALPLTPTEKSYRATHRAATLRGCVAWDASYMSSLAARGTERSALNLLRGLGVPEPQLTGEAGRAWRAGGVAWRGWVGGRDGAAKIAPGCVLWSGREQVLVRVHPAARAQVWAEVAKLAAMQRPKMSAEDLSFDLGTVELAGPGAAEALAAVLRPLDLRGGAAEAWQVLARVTNPASLPANTVLAFTMADPRLGEPHRTLAPPPASDAAVASALSALPAAPASPHALLSAAARAAATSALPTQKALNRRKGACAPGTHPPALAADPAIPAILHTSAAGTWALLLPWRCVAAAWQALVHYPLAAGGRPRAGGLRETRQLHLEAGLPWFPADFPGTAAGRAFEAAEAARRHASWAARPPGRRADFAGEVGRGWACDWDALDGGGGELAAVRLAVLGRGTAGECARIYRVPEAQRAAWLGQVPGSGRVVQAGQPGYPEAPAREHLAGFVTAGNYNLGAGRATAVGSVAAGALRGARGLCVVRDAGSGVARLARWEPAGLA